MNIEDCDLTFEEGINVIGGKNGNGKSAIFAAQAFCLTGAKRGDSWKDFIRIGSDKMTVEMELYKYKGDEPMTFYIEGNSNSSSMIREIRYKEEYAKNVECDALIEKYFDTDMMENVLFHLQDSSSITNITPAKRREILKKIFNSDFTNILEIIKADITSYKEKIKVNETKLQVFNNLKFEYRDLLPVPEVNIPYLEKNIVALEELYISNREKINVKNSEIQNIKTLQDSLQSDLQTLTSNKASYTQTIEAASEYIRTAGLIPEEEFKQKEIEIESLKNLSIDNKKELDRVLESIAEYKLRLLVEYDKLVSCKTNIQNYQKQLSVFDTNSLCPTCGQECDAKHKSILINLIERFNSDLVEYQKEYDLCEKSLNELQITKKELMDNEVKNKEKIYKLESNISFQKKDNERTILLIEEKQKWIEDHREKLQQVEVRYNEVKTSLDAIDVTMLESLQAEVNSYSSKEKELLQAIGSNKDTIKEVETILLLNKEKEKYNLETKNKEMENKQNVINLTKEIDEAKKEIADLDFIKSVYDSDLPNHIMMKACLFLQNGINNFMNTTKDNFQVKLQLTSKGIDFFYKARNEPDWLKAKMASGFESAILTLAFKFTVALAYDTKYIIFDEPDKAADETSSLKLIKTISDVDGFDQIFITTHRPTALEYLKETGANILIANNGKYSYY